MYFRKDETEFLQQVFESKTFNYRDGSYFFTLCKVFGQSPHNFITEFSKDKRNVSISTANGKMILYAKNQCIQLTLREHLELLETLMKPFDILNIPIEELYDYEFEEAGELFLKDKIVTLDSLDTASYIYSLAKNLPKHKNYKAAENSCSKRLLSLINS